MKKQLLVGLATGLFLYGMTSTAMALSFDVSTSGTFENPIGAPYMLTTGVGTDLFTWGNGTYFSSPSSRLEFEGMPFSMVDDGNPFVVGTLKFDNGIIALGTEAHNVNLNIELMFTGPSVFTENFSFLLDLINTPNKGIDDKDDADYVYLPSAYSKTIFNQGVTDYTLTLEFGDITGPEAFGSPDEFHVYELGSATAQLMGTITSDVAPVPEPATMLLFGTGMAGLAGYRRRQQAKKK